MKMQTFKDALYIVWMSWVTIVVFALSAGMAWVAVKDFAEDVKEERKIEKHKVQRNKQKWLT